MGEYYKPYTSVSASAPQQVIAQSKLPEVLNQAGSIFQKAMDNVRNRELEDYKIAQEQERYKNTLGFQQRAEERDIAKIAEERAKTLATNNALAVMENPNVVTSLNTSASDATSQNALAMYNQANADGVVTPQEQALLDSTYQKDLTRDVLTSGSADQKALFDVRQNIKRLGIQEAENKAQAEYRMQSLQNQAENNRLDAANRAASLKIQQDTLNETRAIKNADNLYKQNERLLKEQEKLNVLNLAKSYGINLQLPYEDISKQVAEKAKTHIITPEGKVELIPKTQADFDKQKEKFTEGYTKLMSSPLVTGLADAQWGNDNTASDITKAGLKAGVDPAIIEQAFTAKALKNKEDYISTGVDYSDLNKDYWVLDTSTNKHIGLGDYLKRVNKLGDKFQNVVQPGKGYTLQVGNMSDLSLDERAKILKNTNSSKPLSLGNTTSDGTYLIP